VVDEFDRADLAPADRGGGFQGCQIVQAAHGRNASGRGLRGRGPVPYL
jgi:hypothetical protein